MASKPGAGWASAAVFQLGKGKTLAVPMEVHALARKKVVAQFASKSVVSGVLLMKGGEEKTQYDSDTEVLFRYCFIVFYFRPNCRLDKTPGSTTCLV